VVFGVINCLENRITCVGTPVQDADAANKEYVDAADAATNSRVTNVEAAIQFQLLPTINSAIVTHLTAEVVNHGSYGILHLRNMQMIVPTNAIPSDVSPRIAVTLYKQPLEIGSSTSIESSSSVQIKFGQLYFDFSNRNINFTYSQGYGTSPLVRITVSRFISFSSVNMITNVIHRLKEKQARVIEEIWL
jgi:hypothetical protein